MNVLGGSYSLLQQVNLDKLDRTTNSCSSKYSLRAVERYKLFRRNLKILGTLNASNAGYQNTSLPFDAGYVLSHSTQS